MLEQLGIDQEMLIEVGYFVIAMAIVVAAVIDALKALGVVKPGRAAAWNKLLSTLGGLAVVVVTQLGASDGVPAAQAYGAQIASVVVAALTIAAGAKLVRHVFKWLNGEVALIELSNPFRP